MWSAPEGRLPLPGPDERCVGQHALLVSGLDEDGESLLFDNTYGPGWGHGGSGLLSRDYAERYLREAWTWRVGRCGLTKRNYQRIIAEGASGEELAVAWVADRPAKNGRLWLSGGEYEYLKYDIISFGLECEVEVLEVRRARGPLRRQGWAHLYYPSDDDYIGGLAPAIVRELFVLPDARRHKVATALDYLMNESARSRGREQVELHLTEGDAFGSALEAACSFAANRGYTWRIGPAPVGAVAAGYKYLSRRAVASL